MVQPAEQILRICRIINARSYGKAKIQVCEIQAQAKIPKSEFIKEPVASLGMFDRRWQPGMIGDGELNAYLKQGCNTFAGQLRDIEFDLCNPLNTRACLLNEFKSHMDFKKNQTPTQLKEILMSLLHFEAYSAKDALRLAEQSFRLILDKLVEQSHDFWLLREFQQIERERIRNI